MRFLFITSVLLFLCPFLFAQNAFKAKKWQSTNDDSLLYRILSPLDFSPDATYPLVIFLHGAGERGNDNTSQLKHITHLFLDPKNRALFPSYVVFPQCPKDTYWATLDTEKRMERNTFVFNYQGNPNTVLQSVFHLISELLKNHPIDPDRVYLMGLSMGAMGTLESMARHPELFAGAIAICGAGDPEYSTAMSRTPIWLFHGAKDDIVPPGNSRVLYDVLVGKGAVVRYTEYMEANHNSWDATFAENGLLDWLFLQRKASKVK